MKKGVMLIMIGAIMMSGCEEKYKYNDCHEPIMIEQSKLRSEYPKVLPAQKIVKAGKIVNYKDGDVLFINERNKGIHVVDNRIKGEVTKGDAFIQIPGNIDLAVKDGYLYADSFSDLVVLDIRDLSDIKVVSRKESVFAFDPLQVDREDSTKNKCYMRNIQLTSKVIIGYKE